MKMVFSEQYKNAENEISQFLNNFKKEGEPFGDGKRNKIKLFALQDKKLNIKSFQIPNAVNKIAYRFLRKSKAARSFAYAHALLSKNIGTPYPIAYAEEKEGLFFKKSFYVSEHLSCDLTFRELVTDPDYPEWEKILRAFSRFTFRLHENKIVFLDHSPGNTLIRKNGQEYEFFLVDLNRMNFRELDFNARMKNFSRLTRKKEMIVIMAEEYAEHYDKNKEVVFEKMWFYTQDFRQKFRRKKILKKKLKFWKK